MSEKKIVVELRDYFKELSANAVQVWECKPKMRPVHLCTVPLVDNYKVLPPMTSAELLRSSKPSGEYANVLDIHVNKYSVIYHLASQYGKIQKGVL